MLSVITLADVPGVPPAHKHREGVTHELMVLALDPGHGPYDAKRVRPGSVYFLVPGIAEQFTATDEDARPLAGLAANAVVDGLLCPETSGAPDRIRAQWRFAIDQTLAHTRDPHHKRMD